MPIEKGIVVEDEPVILNYAECTGIFVLAQYVPADYRPLLTALINETTSCSRAWRTAGIRIICS